MRPSPLSSPNAERGSSLGRVPLSEAQAAAERIRSRVPDANLEVVAGDLSLMREVRSLAYEIMESTPRLDGLILNAAEARSQLMLTDEGIETNFATNHLAGFLLTHLLLPTAPILGPGASGRDFIVGPHSGADGRFEQCGHWRPADAGQLSHQQAAEYLVRSGARQAC